MIFTFNSVIFSGAIELEMLLENPVALEKYIISELVWKNAIEGFNAELEKRGRVLERIEDKHVDILKLKYSNNQLYLWMLVLEKDIEDIKNNFSFTYTGEIVLEKNSELKVERLIIGDILYQNGGEWKNLLKKRLTF
ncbi:MAG TPA: hypothetical protein PKX15_06460 [Bacteroidales bacterium]|nr:hypothetical protein [Bacteroidales bacterium]